MPHPLGWGGKTISEPPLAIQTHPDVHIPFEHTHELYSLVNKSVRGAAARAHTCFAQKVVQKAGVYIPAYPPRMLFSLGDTPKPPTRNLGSLYPPGFCARPHRAGLARWLAVASVSPKGFLPEGSPVPRAFRAQRRRPVQSPFPCWCLWSL